MKSGKKPPADSDKVPDYDFWVAMPSWKREEAIALLTGRDPTSPNHHQPSNQDAQKLELLIDRAFSFGVFPNSAQVSPSDCVSIAQSSNVPLPRELLKAFRKKKIDLKNWKSECDRLTAEKETLAKMASDPTPSTITPKENVTGLKKKIGSLQILLLGVAIDKFNMKKDWQSSSVARNISSAITRAGLKLDEDTVRKHLDDAATAKGGKAKFKD
jgi:hypothetical protein